MKRKTRFLLFALLLTGMGLIASPLPARAEGEPYFQGCNVMARNTPSGVQTTPSAQVIDSNGTVPNTISSLTVNGPGNFEYNFTQADYTAVYNQYWHAIPGQPADGEYTFTVTDNEGKTATSHYYLEVGTIIPLPDPASLQASGDSLAPTLSWGAVSGYEGNLFYRARIFDMDFNIIWTSWFITQTSVNVPQGILDDGAPYQWWVEAFDNYRYDASDNRAVSGTVPLAIDNSRPYFRWACVYNGHSESGFYTAFLASVIDPDGSLPDSVDSFTVTGPGVNFAFQPSELNQYGDEYIYEHHIDGKPQDGIYTFTLTDIDQNTSVTYDYIKVHDVPLIDSATLQASGDALTPTLSWGAPANMDQSLYYQVIISDKQGGWEWRSGITPETYLAVPNGTLQAGVEYSWHVRAIDDNNWVHFSNRSNSNQADLVIDDARPYFQYATVYKRHDPDGIFTAIEIFLIDPNGTVPGDIVSLIVKHPDGNDLCTFQPEDYSSYWGSYYCRIPGAPDEGVYTITATDTENNTSVTHAFVKAVAEIPSFDEASFLVSGDPLAPTISWSAVSGYQGHLYYRLWVNGSQDNFVYISGREPLTAQTIPQGNIEPGKSYLFRVEAYDHWRWIIYNSRSNSRWFALSTGEPATISGQVSYAGTAGGTYYIGLFPASAGEDWINQDPIRGVASTDGTYTFANPQPGSYFIAAYRDTDGNQERDKNEPLGFYTGTSDPADQNGLPLAIVLGAGEPVSRDFPIFDRPYFVENEIFVDRENFHESGSFTVIPNSEVLHAEAKVGYRPGVGQITSVTVSGSNISGEAELSDDGIFPDDDAGDGEFSGWVETTDDPVGAGPYTFKATANSLIAYDEDHYIQGSSIDHPTVVAPGAYADGTPLLFDWNAPPGGGVAGYSLIIFDSADPTTEDDILFLKDDITDTQYLLTDQDLQDFNFQLNEGSTYYWLVAAHDLGENNTGYSEYRSFRIDTIRPTTVADPPPGYYNADFNVTLTASEPADITYTTDGTPPETSPTATTESWPVTIPITTEGTHIIRFFATDNAGHKETPSKTLEVTLDTKHPDTTPDLQEGTYGTAQQVELGVDEINPDKTYYALLTSPPSDPPAQPTTVYTTPIDLPVSGEVVDYWLVYYSEDLAGNEEAFKVAHYTIDTRVPVTNFSFTKPVNEYNNAYYANTTLVLTLSSPNNTIYYRWGVGTAPDPTTERPYFDGTGDITLDAEPNKEIHYVVKFFAVGLGLPEQIRTLHIYVDLVQPAAPAFDPEPTSPTNVPLQTIGGTKDADTAIYRGVADPIVALNPDTTWSYGYALTEGPNQILVFARDVAGNDSDTVQADIVLDTVKPYTSGHDPERNTTDPQPLNKQVIVHVEDAAVGVDVDSIRLNVNGIEYAKVDAAISINETNINDMVVTFTPPELYPAETNVPVAVDAKDLAGNVMIQDSYTFLTSPNVAIAPTAIGLIPGDAYTFTATGGSPPYEWTSDPSATSSITPSADTTQADFTATEVAVYTVTVTDAVSDQAQATVDVITAITITPAHDPMESGALNDFDAKGGKVDGQVDWEASAGTIGPDGTFTAPTVLTGKQTVTITAYDKTYNKAHITPVKTEYTLMVFAPMSIAEQPPGYEEGNPSTYPLLALGVETTLRAVDDTRSYDWIVADWNGIAIHSQTTGEAAYTLDPDVLFAASGAGIYTVTLIDKDNPGFTAATLKVRVPMKFVAGKFAGQDVQNAGTYSDTQGIDTFTVYGGPTVSAYIYAALDLSGVEVTEPNCGSFATSSATDNTNDFTFTNGIDEIASFRVRVTLDSTSANLDVQRLIDADLDELWSGIFRVVPVIEYNGRVVDADTGDPIVAATVTATHDATITATTSDQPMHEGEFTIPDLPKTGATYKFLVSKAGYVDKIVTGDEILAGDIMLEALVGGGTISGAITLSDGGSPENTRIQVKADGDYVEDGSGTVITVFADPSTGAYISPVPADYATALEYAIEVKKNGYIFDEDAGLGILILTGVPLDVTGADLELKPVTIISVSGTREDSDTDGTYDQVLVKITAKAGPDMFNGTTGEIRVEDSAGTPITLDAFGSVEANTWSFTHTAYENFTITVYADVSEDTRDVDAGYAATKVWHYVKSAALAGEGVIFNPNVDGGTVRFGNTTVYLPPGGLTGDIRNSVTISIVEAEPEPGAASGMVEIVMTEESGDKCDNADIQRIEITMKFNPAVVTKGTLEDGTFVILQGDNMLRVAEGTGSGVPASQIILPVDYVNGYVTFWVDHLSGFAVASPPAGPGPAPAGGGGGGGCFIDTAGSEFRR